CLTQIAWQTQADCFAAKQNEIFTLTEGGASNGFSILGPKSFVVKITSPSQRPLSKREEWLNNFEKGFRSDDYDALDHPRTHWEYVHSAAGPAAGLSLFARASQSAVEESGGGAVGADPSAPVEQVVNSLCFSHFGLRASGRNE